ncbi:hypothetical protein V8C44DRAFT_334419 [Trichoderma aethiopicum]
MQKRGDSQQLISLLSGFLDGCLPPTEEAQLNGVPRLGAPDRRGERFRRLSAPLSVFIPEEEGIRL